MAKKLLLWLSLALILPLGACSFLDADSDQGSTPAPPVVEEEMTPVLLTQGQMSVSFPKDWKLNQETNPYDVQYLSPKGDTNMGIFLYAKEDLAEEDGIQKLLDFHVEDLKSKRQNFKLVEPQTTIETADKTITQVVYSGEKNGGAFYYQFSAIEFKDSNNTIPITLAVSLPSAWDNSKATLAKIHNSFTSLLEPPQKP
jgi:hypothetical protein